VWQQESYITSAKANLLTWHYWRENDGQGYLGRKRMELLHDMMEGRDYGQLKDLISDRSRWRQDSK